MSGATDQESAPRIAIIGGGLAGLAAAIGLADRGLHVELFEARRQLGGRTGAFRDPASGALIDNCQHVTLGCCTNFEDFCRRTGLNQFLRRDRTLYFIGPDGHRRDLRASPWLPAPLHLLPSLLRLSYLTWAERIGVIRAMRQLAGRSQGNNVDDATIGNWLRQNGQSPRAIELFWTPIVVSALSETIGRAAVPPVRKVFVDAFLGQRNAYEMAVPQVPLAEFYGQRLQQWFQEHGVLVRQECAVKQLMGSLEKVGELEIAGGEKLPFNAVIVAVPWRRASELFSEPLRSALPQLNSLDQFESASIAAVHLWFDRSITSLPHAVLPGRLSQWLFNRGPQPGRNGHHYQVIVSASQALSELPRDDVIAAVHRELMDIWPLAREAILLQSQMITEQHAVFSPLPGIERFRPPQQTSVPNLFLAGDWTATGWPSTMESAVRSGYLAAEGVLSHFGRPAKLLVPDVPQPPLARWLFG